MDLERLVDRLRELPRQAILYYEGAALVRKTYPEVFADAERFGRRLGESGVARGAHVGLLAENSYEWIVCELALLRAGCVSVCFSPDEFAASTFEELADEYRLSLLVASAREIERRGGRPPDWVMPLVGSDAPARAREAAGDWSLDPDVFTLVFSSGTSGKLKCLLISRRGTEELIESFGELYAFRPEDAILVFLPLSIYQQRWMLYTALRYGFDLHLAEPARLFKALKEMRPTIIGAPPLFYEVFEKRFRALPARKRVPLEVAGRLASLLGPLRPALARRIFAPFHDALGGRTRLMLTGAAQTRRSTLDCFALLGLPLFEGYGLTETGYISINLPGRNRVGSVGRPVARGSVSIAEDGEIVFSSPHPLSRGYLFADEREMRQTYLDDQRIATGDIGRFDSDGYLYLTGRKKEIIITQGGYKVHPESIEREIERAPGVSRAVVFGGGELAGLAALVAMPARDASAEGRVRASVDRLNRQLPPPTRIGHVVFSATEFTTENGFLNRNLKVDRRAVFAAYRRELSGLE